MQNFSCDGTPPPVSSPPSVTTSPGTATNTTTATIGGDVTADGGATVTNRGVVYTTTTGVTITDNKTQSGSGTGAFTANLTSLSVNQQYFFKAYAQNSEGTTLGSELEFWTWANVPSAPTVNNPDTTSLDVNVNVNANPASTLFSIQVTNSSLFVQTNGTLGATEHWRTDAAWGTTTVTGLSPSQQYGFQVRAQNGQGTLTAYSSVANGTTAAGAVAPSVTTVAGTATNTTTATVGGNVTADGGATVTNRGVVYKTTAGVAITDNKTQSGTGTGAFTANLTSLSVNQQYYFRAYAQNSEGTTLGSELQFWTWANAPTAPTVDNPTISTLDVNVNPNGNPVSTLFAIQVTNNSQYVQSNGTVGVTEHWLTDAAWGAMTVTGLNPGQQYGFQVRAQNGQGTLTAYAAVGSGTTLATTPTVTTAVATVTNLMTASSGGNVTATGGATVTNRGVVWALSPATPTVPGSQSTNGTGTGGFTSILTNLTAGATYNYRAFAQNSAGTAYGAQYSLTTPCFVGSVFGLVASATNDTSFTAAWSALTGASGYTLDVSTNSGFAVGAAGNYGVEVFTNVGGGTTSSYLTRDWTNNGIAWTAFKARTDQTLDGEAVTLQNASGAYVISQTITGGVNEISITHQLKFSGADSFDIFVNAIKVATNITYSATITTTVVSGIDVAGDFTIMVTNNSGGRVALDNLTWTNGGSTADFIPGYSNRVVAGTSQAVTGLTAGATYYFRVQATNDYCTSDYSSTQSVVTVLAAPEIAVSGNGVNIADGDTTPTVTDHTDFGSASVVGGTVTRTYTITNSGNANLTLGTVTTSGTHAADFIITSQPATPVVPGGSTTFAVQFDPSASGTRSASVSFTNDDANENPFNFDIQGTGTAPEIAVSGNNVNITDGDASPTVTDHTDFSTVLIDGGTLTRTYTITNSGNENLTLGTVTTGGTHAADFIVTAQPSTPIAPGGSTTFSVQFDPSATGTRSATVSFSNNDADENPFNFSIQGTGTAPEIEVSGNGLDITDGDATPSTLDGTDFGSVLVGNDVDQVFVITNSGSASLTVGNVTTSGTHAADFIVISQPASPVAPGGTTSFTLRFTPSASGTRSAAVSFTNSDSDEDPFNFSVQGNGVLAAPNIVVLGTNLAVITNGDVTPATADGTDFGSALMVGATVSRTFTITNSGTATLTISGVTTSGTHAADFTITTAPGGSVAPGATTTFVVEFDPSDRGSRSATISIGNNDGPNNPYAFDVAGFGLAPEVAVSGNGVNIVDGDATPTTTDHTDFNSVNVDGDTLVRTFTVTNSGNSTLTLGSVTIGGTHAADFTVTLALPGTLAVSNGTTFQITFDPSASGVRSATVSFATDDPDENPFNFSIQGTGEVTPEIAVLGINDAVITDGDVTPISTDGTDFGATLVTGGQVDNTLFITNSGLGLLTITGVTTSGTHAADFIVMSYPTTVVAGTRSNLVLRFNPTAAGTRNATITITNDDSDEDVYDFSVRGTGQVAATVSTTIASATNTTTATSGGNVTADGGATVTNRGVVWALSPSTPTVPGAQTTNGTGTGSFSATLTNLTPGATYNYRAFAQNAAGTSYGAQQSLTTPCFSGVVTGLLASATNLYDFTATWSNFAGATGYQLDVATVSNFSGVVSTNGIQDFEASPATPEATYSASGGGIVSGDSASGDRPASSPFASSGTDAYSALNTTATVTFDPLDTTGLSDLTLSLRVASFSISSTGNGADAGDIVTVSISPDNGATYYPTVRILGNSNAQWSYADGTGVASTDYDGNVTPVDYQPAGGGNRTTDGYSTVIVSNLPAVSQLRVRVAMLNNSTSERWTMDDVVITGSSGGYVDGYSNRVVTGTSATVTGLTDGVTYYFRVRATNDYCTTANSATQAVTTVLGADIVPPALVGFNINGGSFTDFQIRNGFSITGQVFDIGGVSNAAHTPYLFLKNNSNTVILASNKFDTAPANGTTTLSGLAESFAGAAYVDVFLGSYTGTVGAADQAGNTAVSNFVLTVSDDDSVSPTISSADLSYGGLGSRYFAITTNSSPATVTNRAGTFTDVRYTLTDAELNEANARDLRFAFGVRDADSGIARGIAGTTNTVMNFSVESIISGNFTNYRADLSSANYTNDRTTNVWAFPAGFFTETMINNLMAVSSNRVSITVPDDDNDRADDQSVLYDQTVGWLTAIDDDTDAPVISSVRLNNVGAGSVGTVFISQYYEGASNDKWIELFNPGTASIDLGAEGYSIGFWNNANREGWKTGVAPSSFIALTGTIPAGGTYLIADSSALLPGYASADQTGVSMSGDDSVVLFLGSSYSTTGIVDSIGVTGNVLEDTSIVRDSAINVGNTATVDYVSADWDVYTVATVNAAGAGVPERIGYHSAPPVVGSDVLTDGELVTGVSLTGLVQDAFSGIYGTNTTGVFAPTVNVFNASGTAVYGSRWLSGPTNGGARTAASFSNLVTLAPGDITIGMTYTSRVVVWDYDQDRTGDQLGATQTIAFVAIDDDTNAPALGGFSLAGGSTNLDLGLGSMVITGLIADASGIDFTRTYYLVRDFTGTVVLSNVLYGSTSTNTWVAHTNSSIGSLSCGNAYTVTVYAFDADLDRGAIDSLGITGGVFVVQATGVGGAPDYPRATNLLVNGTAASLANTLTDSQIAGGGWSLAMSLTHPIGVFTNSSSPYFRVTNGLGIAIDATPWSNTFISGTTTAFTNDSLPGVSYANVALGTYAVVWSASNQGACVASIEDREVIDGGTNVFTVIDDDTAGPVLSGFVISGSSSTIDISVAASGFSVTGMVQDAGSGVAFTSAPPYFLFYDVSGAVLASNTFSGFSEGDGLGSPAALTNWFSGLSLACGNVYTVRVVAADADNDRAGDRSSTTTNVLLITTTGAGGDAPFASNLLVSGTPAASATITDASISTGGWSLAMTISHTSGDIVTNGPTQPSFVLNNPSNTHVFATTPLTWDTIFKSGSNYYATNALMPSAEYASIMTGVYSLVWSAQSDGLCFGSTNASTTVSPGTNRFVVIDDDVAPPNLFDLDVGGGTGTGCGGSGGGGCPDPTATNLVAGDIAIFAINTLTTGSLNYDSFAFVTLVDIPTGTEIKFTDNGWKSSTASFRTGEGFLTWRATNCVPAGTVVRWISTNSVVFNIGERVGTSPNFAPNIQGEQILAFQGSSSNPSFLYAVNDRLTGVWDVDATDTHSSALPPGLTDGYTAVAVGEFDNIIINTNVLSLAGSREDILYYIGNQESWIGSDFVAYDLLAYNFTFPDVCASGGVITDHDVFIGGWSITGRVQDLISGVAVSNASGLRYVVMNTNGGLVVSNYFTTTFPAGSTTLNGFSNSVIAGSYPLIQIGTYTAQIHVADIDNDRPFDAAERSTNVPFQVIDDDTDPPQIGFFYINGQTILTNPAQLVSVVISGQVRDVTSGIGFTSQPPAITVLDAFGGVAYTGVFANAPVGEGAATNWEPIWTSPINLSGIADCGTYTVRVTIADADDDRLGDRMTVTQQFLIAVTDGSGQTPAATNFLVNGVPSTMATITDGDLAAGGWSVAISLTHPSGVEIDPPYTPSFIVRDPFAVDVLASEWSNIVTIGTTFYATNAPLDSIPYGNVHTGYYSLLWSARSQGACYGEILDASAINGGTNTFLVIDDDVIGLGFTNLTYNTTRANALVTSFENAEGWSNTVSSTYMTGFITSRDGVWNLENVAANTAGGAASPDRKLQFLAGSTIALPSANDPGTLMFLARGATGAGTNLVTVDYWPAGGVDWINVGLTNAVAGTNYSLVAFPVDIVGDATVRVHAVQINDTALHVDDLSLTRYLAWTNTTGIELAWANPTNDVSGVHQYRYDHAPADIPTNLTDGVATTTNTASFSASVEGVITGYVFMVDNDDDRANDRARGMNVPYVARIDLTPPVVVTNLSLSNDILDVNDDTSEIKVSWSPEANEAIAAGRRGDGEPLSPWQSYHIYYTDADTGPTTNDTYLAVSADYPELGYHTNHTIIMSNLIMGLEYRIAVAGVDQAGNIGPMSDVETKRLNVFTVTQAFVNAEGEVVVQWVGLPDRPYDVIYTDSSGYYDSIDASWKLAQTVTGTNFVDRGGTNEGTSVVRPHPAALPYKTMRFYRVAPVNGWISSAQRSGAASEQVIVALNAELKHYYTNGVHYGYNFIGKGMIPMVNSLAEFLGTNRLPSGLTANSSSQIILYEPSPQGAPNPTNFWLAQNSGPGWKRSTDDSNANATALPSTNRGFSIRVPSSTNLLLVGRVPWTNTPSFSMLTSAFNILSLNLPRPTTIGELGDMGLRTNLTRGTIISRTDEIRILQRGYGPYASPKARIYLNLAGVFTFWSGGSGSAEGYVIEADDAVIIQIKTNTSPFELSFEPQQFYTPPAVVITSATPAAPTVVALTPTSVSGSGATLNGTVNPNYLTSVAYYRYGLTTNYGFTTGTTNLPATNVSLSVPMPITGLSPGTTYHIQLVATNAAGASRFGTRSFATACANVSLITTTLPNGSLLGSYSTNLSATGGASPYSFVVTGGIMPGGLSLGAGGLISGTPSSSGNYTFYVTATDTNGCASSSTALSILITNNCSITSSVINVSAASDGTSTNHVTVSWLDGANEDGYQVWRHTVNNSSLATFLTATAVNVTNITDATATPGQKYYYWVKGTNCAGASAFGTGDSGFRKLATVPGVSATDNAYSDKVEVSWSDLTGETAYVIYRNGSDSFGGASPIGATGGDVTEYDDYSASAGVTYYYWVRGSNSTSGALSDSGASDAGTRNAVGLPILSAPTVTAITSTGATLGATLDSFGGMLEGRGTVWGLTPTPTGNILDAGGTTTGVFSHVRTDMPPGTLIYFRGWATNVVGLGYSSEDSFWTAPSNVMLSAATERNTNRFLANWLAATGATNYQLSVSTDDTFGSWLNGYSNRVVGNVTSHTVTGLTVGTYYYYRVRAENSGGLGGYSGTNLAITVEPEPLVQATSIGFTNVGATNITVTWTSGDGEYRMVVARAANAVNSLPVDGDVYTGSGVFGSGSVLGSNNYVVSYATTGTSVNVNGLQTNTVYFFRVFEYNGSSGAQNYMTNSATGNPQGQITN